MHFESNPKADVRAAAVAGFLHLMTQIVPRDQRINDNLKHSLAVALDDDLISVIIQFRHNESLPQEQRDQVAVMMGNNLIVELFGDLGERIGPDFVSSCAIGAVLRPSEIEKIADNDLVRTISANRTFSK